jgi:hypothetical protein
MPTPIDPAVKSQIKRSYMANVSVEEIARTFGVGQRSIERWIAAEDWATEKKANNVIDLTNRPKPGRSRPPMVRRDKEGEMSAVEIANNAIADLYGEMARGLEGRDKAAVANCLRAWVEYRERIRPATIEGLVEQVVLSLSEWGLSPVDFAKALRDRRSS